MFQLVEIELMTSLLAHKLRSICIWTGVLSLPIAFLIVARIILRLLWYLIQSYKLVIFCLYIIFLMVLNLYLIGHKLEMTIDPTYIWITDILNSWIGWSEILPAKVQVGTPNANQIGPTPAIFPIPVLQLPAPPVPVFQPAKPPMQLWIVDWWVYLLCWIVIVATYLEYLFFKHSFTFIWSYLTGTISI